MDYYRDTVTDLSWNHLTDLAVTYKFTLIGGWAVWLHTKALKSKDIDIIIDLPTLGKLRESFNVTKNERLQKYEIIRDSVHIDIYVPHWSDLGIPTKTINNNLMTLAGFRVPKPEILLILKQVAYEARVGSAKGRKDLLDMISLLSLPEFSWALYRQLMRKTGIPLTKILRPIVDVPELSLNRHAFSKLKKKWLAELILRS